MNFSLSSFLVALFLSYVAVNGTEDDHHDGGHDGGHGGSDCELDILLALDESGSLSNTEFSEVKGFGGSLVQAVSSGSNIGVIAFDTTARTIHDLDDNQDRTNIVNKIQAIIQGDGATNFEAAIDLAISMEQADGTSLPNVFIMVTDGDPNTPNNDPCNEPLNKKTALDNANMVPFIIGIGEGFSSSKVECLVDDIDTQIHHIDDFGASLDALVEIIADLICNICEFELTECDSAYSEDCTCENDYNCDKCRPSGICKKCHDGWFLPYHDRESWCTPCSTFGYACTDCNDLSGCKACKNGYELVFDEECGLYKCEDEECLGKDKYCKIDLDYKGCPKPCNDYGKPCDCSKDCLFCDYGQCKVNGCNQCKPGYFKKDYNYPCIHCQEYFGEGCMFCQDFNGCGQCKQGYTRRKMDECSIYGKTDFYHCVKDGSNYGTWYR